MMLYLKKLSLSDGEEIYQLLQEIGKNENGFYNPVFGMTYPQYQEWLAHEFAVDSGELEDWMVPQTSYWMYDDDIPVGYGRFRHTLNESLRRTSGHIGYAVAASKRGQGYGNEILSLLLEECRKLGLSQVQIAANADNIPSNCVIRKNGGVLERTENEENIYQIMLAE